MNDHLGAIDEHPFAAFFALNRHHLTTGLAHFVAHVAGQRLGLSRALGGGHDDRVVHRRQRTRVEHGDVARLDVLKGGDGGFFDFGIAQFFPFFLFFPLLLH